MKRLLLCTFLIFTSCSNNPNNHTQHGNVLEVKSHMFIHNTFHYAFGKVNTSILVLIPDDYGYVNEYKYMKK